MLGGRVGGSACFAARATRVWGQAFWDVEAPGAIGELPCRERGWARPGGFVDIHGVSLRRVLRMGDRDGCPGRRPLDGPGI